MASSSSFSGRTIIVTGAAGVVGGAVASALAAAGADVVLVDIAKDALETKATQIQSEDGSVVTCACSASETDTIIPAALGMSGRIDAVFNAVATQKYAPFEDQTPDALRQVLEANLIGPMALVRAAWPIFQKQKYGRVVNCTSDSLWGMVNSAAYVMSKGALLGVNKALAAEGKPFGITVNCVAPVAWSPMSAQNAQDLPPEAQAVYQNVFPGESNVGMVLALCHERNTASGETYSIGGNAVGKIVLGAVAGPNGLRTMDDCFERWDEIDGEEKKIHEPQDLEDVVKFKLSYTL